MFQQGTRYAWPDGDSAEIEVLDMGAVTLATGRLAVRGNDAWVADPEGGGEAFTEELAPGRYRVLLSMVDFNRPRVWQRVAAVKVAIKDEYVSLWEMALRPGQVPSKPREEGSSGLRSTAGWVTARTRCGSDARRAVNPFAKTMHAEHDLAARSEDIIRNGLGRFTA
ncbi:DUF4241 domain-containing protein [Streptosporangium sp. NPDC087985]|uniref:DUF4241 domain-containing protein n=1 Tax=Streptosporangium sp. NPDC087985 TaxID=3366196 RepID=UPI003805A163